MSRRQTNKNHPIIQGVSFLIVFQIIIFDLLKMFEDVWTFNLITQGPGLIFEKVLNKLASETPHWPFVCRFNFSSFRFTKIAKNWVRPFLARTHALSHPRFSPARTSHARVRFAWSHLAPALALQITYIGNMYLFLLVLMRGILWCISLVEMSIFPQLQKDKAILNASTRCYFKFF